MSESQNNTKTDFLAPNGGTINIFERKNEIILLDYFYVLLKRKFLIALIFVLIVAGSVIVNLLLSKTFESSGILKIGKYKGQPIEQEVDLNVILLAEPSLRQLAAKLGLPETSSGKVSNSFKITVANIAEKKSNFIKIIGRGKSPEEALKLTSIVINFILQRHEVIFSDAQKLFNLEVEAIKRNLEKTKGDITETEELIVSLDNDLKFYIAEIKTRSNAQSEAQGRIVQSYIELMNSTKKEKESKIARLASLKLDLKNFDLQFQQKELEKKYETNPSHVEIEPTLPRGKIAPKRRQNVIFASVIALFFSVFAGFAVEYVAENKNRRRTLSQIRPAVMDTLEHPLINDKA